MAASCTPEVTKRWLSFTRQGGGEEVYRRCAEGVQKVCPTPTVGGVAHGKGGQSVCGYFNLGGLVAGWMADWLAGWMDG